MACCKAGAQNELYEHIGKLFGNKKFVLPVPAFNIINGGQHAGNKLEQELAQQPGLARRLPRFGKGPKDTTYIG